MPTPLNRRPVYAKPDVLRVVSRPNGRWRAEQFADRRPEDDRARTDPWKAISRDTSFEAAQSLIRTHGGSFE